MMLTIWSKRFSGARGWHAVDERQSFPENVQAWLEVFRSDEPGVAFLASQAEPDLQHRDWLSRLPRLSPEPDLKAVPARREPIQGLGEIGRVLNVETDLGNAAPDRRGSGEAIDDVPAVDRVRLDVEPLSHSETLPHMESARMATRYTYATSVSFGGDVPTAEFDVVLVYGFIPGRDETPPAYDHGGLPAEPAMVEDIEVLTVDGKPRPWDRCGGYVSDDELADAILNQLGDIDNELIAHAVETDASMATLCGLLKGRALESGRHD